MGRIFKGIEETDRDGFDPQPEQGAHHLPGLIRIEGLQDGPVAADPLVHLEAISSGDQRLGEFREEVVGGIAHLPADFQHVPEALGGDQPGFGPLALDDGIDDQGRAMDQLVQSGHEVRCGRFQRPDSLFHGIRGVPGSGQALAGLDLPGLIVQQDKVGKGAADITAESVMFSWHK